MKLGKSNNAGTKKQTKGEIMAKGKEGRKEKNYGRKEKNGRNIMARRMEGKK